MSDSALRAFDAATPRERVAVARRFWDSRDPEALNGSAERLREHYRRMDYAHRQYPLIPQGHRYDSLLAFDATGSRFDDRGRMFVRHGEPDARTSLSMAGLPPNESWVYHRPGGDLLFNFAQPDSAQGYRMYESLFDIVGLGTAARVTGQGNVRARLEAGTPVVTYGAAWTAQAAAGVVVLAPEAQPDLPAHPLGGNQGRHVVAAIRARGRTPKHRDRPADRQLEVRLRTAAQRPASTSSPSGPMRRVRRFRSSSPFRAASLYAPPSNGRVIYPIRTRVAVRNSAGQVVAVGRYAAQFHRRACRDRRRKSAGPPAGARPARQLHRPRRTGDREPRHGDHAAGGARRRTLGAGDRTVGPGARRAQRAAAVAHHVGGHGLDQPAAPVQVERADAAVFRGRRHRRRRRVPRSAGRDPPGPQRRADCSSASAPSRPRRRINSIAKSTSGASQRATMFCRSRCRLPPVARRCGSANSS